MIWVLPLFVLLHYSVGIRNDLLVTAQWLSTLIAGETTASSAGYIIVHVNNGPAENEYVQGHIPGAVYLDTNAIEKPPLWNLIPDEELKHVFQQLGISMTKTVIVYSTTTFAATRVIWAMMYAGIQDVRLLDGGYFSWVQEYGISLEDSINVDPKPIAYFGHLERSNKFFLATTQEIEDIVLGIEPKPNIVDIRSWNEHSECIPGYNGLTIGGRIPGSKWGHGGSDAMHMEDFEYPNGTLRSLESIRLMWEESGIYDNPLGNIFYCGTGWRASQAWFVALLLGWQETKIYDEGWWAWSKKPLHFLDQQACKFRQS